MNLECRMAEPGFRGDNVVREVPSCTAVRVRCPRVIRTLLAIVVAGGVSLRTDPVPAQTPVSLPAVDAAFAEPFSLIRGARELDGGRLLIADWIEQRLVVLDFANGSAKDIGREGSGPEEFRLPTSLLPFRGDSVVLVDVGNSRLSILDGTGAIRRVFQSRNPSANSPGGTDRSGRLFFVVPGWRATEPLPGD
jgi:hypothetical protein